MEEIDALVRVDGLVIYVSMMRMGVVTGTGAMERVERT